MKKIDKEEKKRDSLKKIDKEEKKRASLKKSDKEEKKMDRRPATPFGMVMVVMVMVVNQS